MASRWSSFAVDLPVLLLLAAQPAAAATVLERSVAVEVRPDGSVSERTRLEVRLDRERDLASWSPYPIALDENLKLTSLVATARKPDGKVVVVPRKDLDTLELAGGSILHSSRKLRTVTFPPLPAGSVLSLEYEVVERPYFPAGWIALGASDPTARLSVQVRGGGGLRWRLDGPRDGLSVEEGPGSVAVTAAGLPAARPPELAPAGASRGTVLRYAWGPEAASWESVGRWYEELLRPVPRAAAPVRDQARTLAAALPGRRERIEALLAFVRREVRYVAVEVGIGGYRPHAPEEILARRWGDCKDKTLLLLDLLREVGIEAYPALVLAAEDDRVDPELPSPFSFNHLIAAVPAAGLDLPAGAPVAGGYLFLDATQPVGGLAWLQPAVQDQEALVVRGAGSALVRTPSRPELEARTVVVDLVVAPDGSAAGEARLEVAGGLGAAFADGFAAAHPGDLEQALRSLLGDLVPGAELAGLRWSARKEGVPAVTVTARVRLPELMTSPGPAGSLLLGGPDATPSPGLLDGRTVPVVASAGTDGFTWRLRLPAAPCPPAGGQEVLVDNEVGSFRQQVRVEDGILVVERRTGIARRWIEPAAFPALKDLALAERRAARKRVRLDCGGAPGAQAAGGGGGGGGGSTSISTSGRSSGGT